MASQTINRAEIIEPRATASGLLLKASESFVDTPRVHELTQRALTYLSVGYPVHLAGPAGTGKTTLAFHIAAQLGRPVSLLHGNDEFGTSDLIGRDAGYRKSTLVDNYIHSVLKTEERMNVHWIDNKLTTACEQGHTLIYDEFNRTPPEANNTLLSILEERILNLPKTGGGDGYLRVHPSFRAIFTSNPEEYAGVHRTQDALLDRLITIQVDHYDQDTEIGITAAKSGLDEEAVAYIVDIARAFRALGPSPHRPTIRACIAVAKIIASRGAKAHPDDPFFRAVSFDVMADSQQLAATGTTRDAALERHDALIREVHAAHLRGESLQFEPRPAAAVTPAPHTKPRTSRSGRN
jgi:nitric oxide reductase NorQ protein